MGTELPLGQRARDDFPRFGVPAYAGRVTRVPPGFQLQIEREDGSACPPVRMEELNRLPRKQIVADFHCVTTWSHRGLAWSGYPFRDFYQTLFVPRAQPRSTSSYLEFKALDGYSTCILLEDLLDENVMLVDRLQNEPLPLEHGAPLRLVAPHLYGYKNVKHLCRIRPRADYRRSFAERQTFAHPRGRIALEERGIGLPGPIYRFIYRALIPATLWLYRRAERRSTLAPVRSDREMRNWW